MVSIYKDNQVRKRKSTALTILALAFRRTGCPGGVAAL